MSNETLTLFELNALVREVVEGHLDGPCWVTGELSDVSTPAFGGHFYGELVQKDEGSDRIIARARITCWARTYNILRLRFQKESGETLRKGLLVKLLVKVSFHEQYGYSLNVLDIDSTYTLGDLAKRRREILLQLEQDGILHDNQTLPLPRLLRRVAVISSATAAGYGDFCHQLEQNVYGFHFDVQLFPAVMQGEQVPSSIIAALDAISTFSDEDGSLPSFDIVVIIRGGGASSDLSDYDNYELAACIAQYPLPVLTGIGHERDETVIDFVAHTRVKTPTAAAAFLIEHQAQEATLLDDLYLRITRLAQERIQYERQRLERQRMVLPLLFANIGRTHHNKLQLLCQRLISVSTRCVEREKHRLELMKHRMESLDPKLLLRRGYSITMCNGKLVRSADGLAEGDELTTYTENGIIKSIIDTWKKN